MYHILKGHGESEVNSGKAMRMIRSLKSKTNRKQLEELGVSLLQNRKLRGGKNSSQPKSKMLLHTKLDKLAY